MLELGFKNKISLKFCKSDFWHFFSGFKEYDWIATEHLVFNINFLNDILRHNTIFFSFFNKIPVSSPPNLPYKYLKIYHLKCVQYRELC